MASRASMADGDLRNPMGPATLGAVAVVGMAALVAFVYMAYGVIHGTALTGIDLRDFARRQGEVSVRDDRYFVMISLVGSPASMTILAICGAIWLGWKRQRLTLVSWVTAFAGVSLLVVILKRTIDRSRPVGAELFLHGTSLSFPSGHAAGSLVGFGMLAYLLSWYYVKTDLARVGLVATSTSLVGLIAYSRLYLGVHYFSDVLAGLLLGAVWLVVCVVATELALGSRARQRP